MQTQTQMQSVTQVKASPVPFKAENVTKCQCGKCPVQKKSACAADLATRLPQNLKKEHLKREEIPGLYCASGQATCNDLNPKNPCVCGTCVIFNEEHHLADQHPAGYFCKGGKAVI